MYVVEVVYENPLQNELSIYRYTVKTYTEAVRDAQAFYEDYVTVPVDTKRCLMLRPDLVRAVFILEGGKGQ